jgi:hypothetical protein
VNPIPELNSLKMGNIMKIFNFSFLIVCGLFSFLSDGFTHTIKGVLDICHLDQGHYCYAWVCSSKHPDRLIALRLSFDGGLITTSSVLANSVREQAVGKECGGNIYRGAFFDLDETIIDFISDGNSHEVTLEALDRETSRYLSLESKRIVGNKAKPIVFFKQIPYQGLIINPTSINDISNLPKGVFGVANWDGMNIPVEFNEMTRIYLNSKEYNLSPDIPFLRSTPFYIFQEKINPWVIGQKLFISVSLGVTSAEKWNDGEAYLVMHTLWSDDEGHKFWFGWQLFDLRPMEEFVALDSCQVCTGWPIVAGYANDGIYGHPALDSARLLNFPGRFPAVKYTIQVTWENFVNAINALRKIQGVTGYPDDPLRYRLESIWLNPEVYIGAPKAGGILDIQFSELLIGVQ